MKKFLFGLTFLALGLTGVAAKAGYFASQPVLLGTSWASGSIVSARTSADTNQYIGCAARTSLSSETGQCWARDAAGNTRSCIMNAAADAPLRTTAKAINNTSMVRFEFNTATGFCTRVDVNQVSEYTNY
jgi:hypothetical protein